MRHAGFLIAPVLVASVACGEAPLTEEEEEVCTEGQHASMLRLLTGPSMRSLSIHARSDDGGWRELELVDASARVHEIPICAVDTFSVVVACEDDLALMGSARTLRQFKTTPDEAKVMYQWCGWNGEAGPAPATFDIEGSMVQPGTVSIGLLGSWGQTENWTFSISAPAGVHDLIAIGEERIALRRGIRVESRVELEPIDLEQDGVDLVAQNIVVEGATAATEYRVWSDIYTAAGGYQQIRHSEQPVIWVPSQDILHADDIVRFRVSTSQRDGEGRQERGAMRRYMYEATTVPLLAPIPTSIIPRGADFVVETSELGVFPEVGRSDELWVRLGAHDVGASAVLMTSRDWIEQRGDAEIGFDLPPEIDASWLVPGYMVREVGFEIDSGIGDYRYSDAVIFD